jgi:hypothetical protein
VREEWEVGIGLERFGGLGVARDGLVTRIDIGHGILLNVVCLVHGRHVNGVPATFSGLAGVASGVDKKMTAWTRKT